MRPRIFVALCVGSLLTLLLLSQLGRESGSNAVQSVRQVHHATDKNRLLKECLDGVVTINAGGRFGNLFMEFATVLGVARKNKLTAVLPARIVRALGSAFEQVGVPTVAEYLVGRNASDGTPCSVLSEKDVRRTKRHWVGKSSQRQRNQEPILLPAYIVLEERIAPLAAELREKLRFREEFRESARSRLLAFGEEVAKAAGVPTEEVVFIGMHARRTDYHEHLRKRYHVKLTAGPEYYARAATWLRRTLQAARGDGAGTSPLPVALVVVSDDMAWANDTLLPVLLQDALPEERNKTQVFPAGSGQQKDPLWDLALLAACNHSVISYGTYGITAAMLAGGHTVVFDLGHRGYHTMKFLRLLPHWTAKK